MIHKRCFHKMPEVVFVVIGKMLLIPCTKAAFTETSTVNDTQVPFLLNAISHIQSYS